MPSMKKSFAEMRVDKLFTHRRLLTNAPQPASASTDGGDQTKSTSMAMHIMVSILVLVIVGTSLYCVYCWRWRRRKSSEIQRIQSERQRHISTSDLPVMDLSTLQEATDNFSKANKLGEGGFGTVYRGVIYGGQQVAVKRLSAQSRQGCAEFKNEVDLIAKLQHRNLVRLLGCCLERNEKLLIYEYLPNKSLDCFLFDYSKRHQLNWKIRYQIIIGVARGLLYLHEDSMPKIIHRDLKASNVLLDNNMNPKISDFGMAKIFEGEEYETNTGRVVGTFGYMAPEYAMEGIFSTKSDTFSFGVLVLEILSGQRNGGSHIQKNGQTLLRHAWHLWNSDRAAEFMDPVLGESYSLAEAWRCFHVGLLCVQENPDDRPNMSSVSLMLKTEQMPLPPPTEPPTFTRLKAFESETSSTTKSGSVKEHSVNEITVTVIQPR